MILEELYLHNFKNFSEKKFKFNTDFIGITGANGAGKTTILDAIHYLSLTKSYINAKDKYNIQFGADSMSLKAKFSKEEDQYIIQLKVGEGKPKEIKKNQKIYARLADHIGFIKTVVISPYDRDLIWEGSDVRRKYLDHLISQLDTAYLQQLMRYNKVLKQRNTLLKFFRDNHTFDKDVLSSYEEEMRISGSYIYQKRQEIMQELKDIFQEVYHEISTQNEKVEILYHSDLDTQSWTQLFESSAELDRQTAYTQKGIHKDDLVLQIFGQAVKRIASQGQQKTYVIAMKLAQTQILINRTAQNPILLLDDIFDKLDAQRVQHLVQLIEAKKYGQVFITDTDEERILRIFKTIPSDSKNIAL